MVKIVDVAAAAKVSVATVSRALNNHSNVDPILAMRVRDAAKELGYRPNAVARSLRKQGTQVWALIITDINNPFYTAVARGVEDVASESGFSVLLCNTDEDLAKEARYLDVAESERVAGVILAPRSKDTDVSRLISSIPLVSIDRSLRSPVDSVLVKSHRGAVIATEHLLAEGWERPGCITGPADAETAVKRLNGYNAACKSNGLTKLSCHVPYHAPGGREAVDRLFSEPEPPDSLFIANSMLALGALEGLKARKLRVGRDVGLITFDDSPWAALIEPPISVVTQPAYEIGRRAAAMLVDRIQGRSPSKPITVMLETEMIIRGSSRRRRR